MPTTRPRYTFTDTGRIQEMLDAAQRRWPDVGDRKSLLLRLAEEGHEILDLADAEMGAEARRQRAFDAIARIPSLVDADLLLSDQAWR